NGNIQICTREEKGLFIDICSMYWSRLGDLPLKLVIQKLCGGNATALDSLIEEVIFTVDDGMISIQFLDEQLSEFEDVREKNRQNALARWSKNKPKSKVNTKKESDGNATASISQSDPNAIRREKKRED